MTNLVTQRDLQGRCAHARVERNRDVLAGVFTEHCRDCGVLLLKIEMIGPVKPRELGAVTSGRLAVGDRGGVDSPEEP